MNDEIKTFKILVISVAVTTLLLVGMVFWIRKTRCLRAYENFQPEWGYFEDCRIVVDGVLTPVDIVRELK